MSKNKERIDRLVLERGLANSRSKSQAIIMAGQVLVNGEPVTKSGHMVSKDAHIEIVAPAPYVSRGGYKLNAALDLFHIDVSNLLCADVGACTGGFTDVLLQRNAARVYSIDVGYGQLDWKLRQDNRVIIMERTNARYLDSLPEKVAFVAVDVSFISLKLVLPSVVSWLARSGDIVALVKPQFEAGRKNVGKGGIVRDPGVHRDVLADLLQWTEERGLNPSGLIRSPITGSGGNVEFLLRLHPGQRDSVTIDGLLAGVGLADSGDEVDSH
jgi:23S rRNA (cytidine1920-2'-O)/16S rRNA (cytidine1409-2'-O)-methyltransferase